MTTEVFSASLPFDARMVKVDSWVQACLTEVRDSGRRVVRFTLSPPYGSVVDRSKPGKQSAVRLKTGGPMYVEPVTFTLTVVSEE